MAAADHDRVGTGRDKAAGATELLNEAQASIETAALVALLQSLNRRMALLNGPARAGLDARIAVWNSGSQERCRSAAPVTGPYLPEGMVRDETATGLALLIGRLDDSVADAGQLGGHGHPQLEQLGKQHHVNVAGAISGSTDKPLNGLRSWHEAAPVWTNLRLERELTRAQLGSSAAPGPLNSQWLMLQTLTRLRVLSPGYLLAWMDQLRTMQWLSSASPECHLDAVSAGDKQNGDKRKKARRRQ